MKQSNWFTRCSGSSVKLAFPNCECHAYGRDWCYDCVAAPEYTERPPRYYEGKPRFKLVILTPADVRFLQGYSERKPFVRRKPWQTRRFQG